MNDNIRDDAAQQARPQRRAKGRRVTPVLS